MGIGPGDKTVWRDSAAKMSLIVDIVSIRSGNCCIDSYWNHIVTPRNHVCIGKVKENTDMHRYYKRSLQWHSPFVFEDRFEQYRRKRDKKLVSILKDQSTAVLTWSFEDAFLCPASAKKEYSNSGHFNFYLPKKKL